MFDHSVAHVLVVTKRAVREGKTIGEGLDAACERHAQGDADFQARLGNAAMAWLIDARLQLDAELDSEPEKVAALTLVRRAQELVNARLP